MSVTTGAVNPPAARPDDPIADVLKAVSDSLVRRGFLTTEWLTTVIGVGLTLLLGLVGVSGSTATQIVTVAAPAVLAAVYTIVRGVQKSRVGAIIAELLPQNDQTP